MKIIEKAISSLIPYEFNNKVHGSEQINKIANSIKEFGFQQPIVIDKNNVIIVGHGRYEGAKKLGMEKVPCVIADELSEVQVKKYRILDNKLNESEYDVENLKLELDGLDDMNFGDLEIGTFELFNDVLVRDENYGENFSLPSGDKGNLGQITFTLSDEQKNIIESAIEDVKKTELYKKMNTYGNDNSNGNALSCIIEQWQQQNK